jgi:predicted transcriptional regulator
MSSFTLDITSVSLILSAAAIAIASLSLVIVAAKSSSGGGNANKEIDALAIVEEFKSRNQVLEEKLVDLRVRVEILDLRIAKLTGRTGPREIASEGYVMETPRETRGVMTRPSFSSTISEARRPVSGFPIDPIRREILGAVRDANGVATSGEIQVKVGRSREHVARTMNTLQKQGLLHRNQDARPYTYSITEEGERELLRNV